MKSQHDFVTIRNAYATHTNPFVSSSRPISHHSYEVPYHMCGSFCSAHQLQYITLYGHDGLEIILWHTRDNMEDCGSGLDRLCGLVVRVLDYSCRGPGFDSRSLPKKKVVGLERGPLSLVSTTEELLDRKVAAPVYKTENTFVGIRHADRVAPSIRKSWQSLRRQAAVARPV
jgi:hypothetical protein